MTAAPFLTTFLNVFAAFFTAWAVLKAVEIIEGERRGDDEGMGKGSWSWSWRAESRNEGGLNRNLRSADSMENFIGKSLRTDAVDTRSSQETNVMSQAYQQLTAVSEQ
jgi:hypothetical protein